MFHSRTSSPFLVFFFQVLCQLCNRPCLCPASVPQCAAGVPLVPDGCRCCQVCARQRGEPCSEMLPCDRQKGLQCDFNVDTYGCKNLNRTSLKSRSGSFQPSCDSFCHCRGGGVTCVPACPLTGRLPTPDCPSPQFIRLPGKCCREWVCENLENTVIQDAITGAPVLKQLVQPASSCVEQATQWSACSQSCGAGISTRVSNQNPACKLQMETRLCKVRPCGALVELTKDLLWKGQQGWCKASYRSPGPIRLVHHGCFSTQAYQLRYCGQCSDSRCCMPHQTSTAQVTFRCPTGRLLQKAVMMIHSCVCHNNCPYAPYTNPALWAHRFENDQRTL
uniref:Cellular communication network factor 5 n=1 Tax=Poecilia latipinna TaxID=48699 RepID=A0A3B3VLQ0_9TELE